MARLPAIAGIAILASGMIFSGDFGIRTKYSAKITTSRPPDAMLRGKSISITGREAANFKDRAALELAIEQALSSEFTPAKGAADLNLNFAVLGYEPVSAKTYSQIESRNVVVGKKTTKNIFTGKPMQVDDYQMRNVSVEYWEARGQVSLQVTVRDSSGTVLDAFTPTSQFQQKVELSENRVAKTNRGTLPTPQELEGGLIGKVAADIQKRYTKINETLEVPLAVDHELRVGDGLAGGGQWQEALDAWTSANLKKNQGDKPYNMAVANEALAYKTYDGSRNPDDAEAYFQKAIELYEQALKADPGEKVFRQAMDRCAAMKANFSRAKDQYAAQQRAAEVELAKAEVTAKQEESKRQQEEEAARELNSTRPDTADEASFRTIVRSRMRSLAAAPDEAHQVQLVQLGQSAYKLAEVPSRRVVHQEVGRREKVKSNLELYKQTFSDFVSRDKVLDKKERSDLNDLAKRLDLTAEDTGPVEAQFEYKEPSAARAQSASSTTPAKPNATRKPAPQRPAAPRTAADPGIKKP